MAAFYILQKVTPSIQFGALQTPLTGNPRNLVTEIPDFGGKPYRTLNCSDSTKPPPTQSLMLLQLPVYTPSKEEAADPTLYASNVRKYMVRPQFTVLRTSL